MQEGKLHHKTCWIQTVINRPQMTCCLVIYLNQHCQKIVTMATASLKHGTKCLATNSKHSYLQATINLTRRRNICLLTWSIALQVWIHTPRLEQATLHPHSRQQAGLNLLIYWGPVRLPLQDNSLGRGKRNLLMEIYQLGWIYFLTWIHFQIPMLSDKKIKRMTRSGRVKSTGQNLSIYKHCGGQRALLCQMVKDCYLENSLKTVHLILSNTAQKYWEDLKLCFIQVCVNLLSKAVWLHSIFWVALFYWSLN